MAANVTDGFKKTGASTVTTLAAPGKAIGAASITVGSTTNYPTDTGIVIAIRQVDSDGELVAGTYTEWRATTTSGTTFTIETTPVYGSDQVYPAGSTTQVYIPLSSYSHNELVDGLLEEHNQDGSHGDVTADSLTVSGATTLGTVTATSVTIAGTASAEGWSPLGAAPNTVTANGNKSYDLVFNGTDLTDTITEGMRIRTARTVAAPIQCATFDGTNDYFSKSSPSGMTFTDDFSVSAWVKLTSYGSYNIVSRYNGTSGWVFNLSSSGQLQLYGFNGSVSNARWVTSHQSVPLNKWVHVAAQLDMSAHTATTTTSYTMFDGVDVPAFVTQNGTNPSSLVQAGNLEIGSANTTSFFTGKIAQVAIYSAKVTQATHLAAMNQGLTGSETSLISAYTLSNSVNDLSANNNDLTANGGVLTTTADSPFGNSGVSTTLDYGIVMAKSFSTNTTLTVQVPEGCTIPTTGGVSTVDYSTQSVPYGFPRSNRRWTLEVLQQVRGQQASPTNNTAYNLSSKRILAPIGNWTLGYDSFGYCSSTGSTVNDVRLDLSTSSSGYSATSAFAAGAGYASNVLEIGGSVSKSNSVALTVATTYYLNHRYNTLGTTANVSDLADFYPTRIFADNAYL